MIFLTSPGKTYSVNSISGCTISAGGTTLATIPANVQTTFIAPEEEVLVSDNNAIIVEVTGVGAGGSGEGGSGGPIDLTGVALLEGGNTFTGDQTIEGDVTINGTLTVSGDVTTEGEYIGAEVIETSDTTITPEAGKYYKYTGTEDTLTVAAPDWNGYATISYLETATPVDLQGVTWSPAAPVLTGAGPFVYTLVHAGSGQMLAGAYGYSVATAEAVQAVVPIAWGTYVVRFGLEAEVSAEGTSIGYKAKATGWDSTAVGFAAEAKAPCAVTVGARNTKANSACAITIGSLIRETVNGTIVTHTCTTEGTGSITIGAGANTLNTTTTVDGVETTVESSNSVTIGCKAENKGEASVVIGASGSNTAKGTVTVGAGSKTRGNVSVSVGNYAESAVYSIAAGASALASSSGVSVGYKARSAASKTIAIGCDSKITNTTAADGTVTQSENTTVIGYGASASAPNAVVLGAGARNEGIYNVVIGNSAQGLSSGTETGSSVSIGTGSVSQGQYNTVLGHEAKALRGASTAIGWKSSCKESSLYSTALGGYSYCTASYGVALGYQAGTGTLGCIAIGRGAKANDVGAAVIRSTASDGTYTQLYFSGANTPLANTYEDGEAMMGYVVRDSAGNIMTDAEGNAMVGTQKLSVLFPNNRGENAFTPATLGLDDEYTPKPMFRPSDLNLPVEEPTEEPEDVTINIPEPTMPEPEPYTPLPVYPIVEPEDTTANSPETEPYTPLPVYPIVEPEVPSEV